MVIATPPFDSPDEWRHFSRAYLIAEGHPQAIGRAVGHRLSVPVDLLRIHELHGPRRQPHSFRGQLAKLGEPFDPSVRLPVEGRLGLYSAGLSSPVTYLAQAAVLRLAACAGLSALARLYAGRLATLLAWVALCWLAIRLTPVRRWSFALLCLAPMSLFLAGSLSADPLTSALTLLLLALILRVAYGPHDRVRGGDLAGLLTLLVLIGSTKPGYWPLAAITLLIPRSHFGIGRRRWLFVLGSLFAAAAPAALWGLQVHAADPAPFKPHADPAGQLQYILHHPWAYGSLLLRDMLAQTPGYAVGWVGKLGYLAVELPLVLYVLYPLGVLALCVADGEDPKALGARDRLLLTGVVAASASLVVTLIYLSWNAVGASEITGVQGRYFIPLAPLVAVAVPSRWPRPPIASSWSIGGLCALMLGSSTLCLIRYYYWAS